MSTPTISNISDPVYTEDPFWVFGANFASGVSQLVSWTNSFSGYVLSGTLQNIVGSGFTALPTTPPSGAANAWHQNIFTSGIIAAALLQPPNVLWVLNSGGSYSAPYQVNQPQIYFTEFSGTLTQNQYYRVFGRNLCANNGQGTPQLFLTSSSGLTSGTVYPLLWGRFYDVEGAFDYQLQYELRFNVLSGIPIGNYNLWVYNGADGSYGISQPLPVVVQSGASAPTTVNITAYSGVGDGLTDNYSGFIGAQAALSGTGGTIYFPAGDYLTSHTFVLNSGVSLNGVVKERSRIFASPTLSALSGGTVSDGATVFTGVVKAANGSTISNLTLEGNSLTTNALVLTSGPTNVTVTNCILKNPFAQFVRSGSVNSRCIALCGNPIAGVEVSYCDMQAVNGFYISQVGPIAACRTIGNSFHGDPILTNLCSTSELGGMIGINCIIEGNLSQYSNRGFSCGPFAGPVQQNVFIRNMILNGRFAEGEGESFLFELTQGGANNWYGSPISATANSLTQSGTSWSSGVLSGYQVLIMNGTGVGQVRTISANTASGITVAQNWAVTPDTTSTALISRFSYQNLFVSNESRMTEGGLEISNALDNVVDGHQMLHSRNGMYFIADSIPSSSGSFALGVIALNYVRNSRMQYCGSDQTAGGPGNLPYSAINLQTERDISTLTTTPLIFGNRFINNYFDHCGIVAFDRVFRSGSWLQTTDPLLSGAPPSIQYNAFLNLADVFRGDDPNILNGGLFLDQWTSGIFCNPSTLNGGLPKGAVQW